MIEVEILKQKIGENDIHILEKLALLENPTQLMKGTKMNIQFIPQKNISDQDDLENFNFNVQSVTHLANTEEPLQD